MFSNNPVIHWLLSRLGKSGEIVAEDLVAVFEAEQGIRSLEPGKSITLKSIRFDLAGNSYTEVSIVTRD
jgi:hypothetical protein